MILTAENLGKSYGSFKALEGMSIEIREGEIWCLLGPNGSGKSTAFGMILDMLRPTEGYFQWFSGNEPNPLQKVGCLLEKSRFYPRFTPRKILSLLSSLRGCDKNAIEESLALFSCQFPDRPFEVLSLGQKQRVGLAACFLGNPKVVVLDEPMNGLDPEGIYHTRNVIKEFQEKGGTVIIASHILAEVAQVATHVVIMKPGAIAHQGPVDEFVPEGSTLEDAYMQFVQKGRQTP